MLVSAQVDRNLLQDAGALPSDLPLQLRISRTKGGSAAPQRKPRAVWRICVRLQGCVNKACGWGGLQPDSKAMSQTAYMTQNTRTAVLLPSVSPKYHKCESKLSHLSDCDIFPVSHPSDRNTELFRQWFQVGVHLDPEWSQGASVLKTAVCRWDVGQTCSNHSR